MKNIDVLLIGFQVLSLSEAYNYSCPAPAQWELRAKSKCAPSRNYTCLFDVTLGAKVYRDRCSRPRLLASGYKYVFQPHLNRAACSVFRYQPFVFDTIGRSDCTFVKSFCNSEGQMTYDNGTSKSDRSCLCNFDKGYTFVNKTNNQCSCNPSNEDCSCYIGIYSNNRTIDSNDLKCYEDNNFTSSHQPEDAFHESNNVTTFVDYRHNLLIPTNEYRNKAVVCILILLPSYILVAVVLYILQRCIRLLITPTRFDIVECSDHSITVRWYIHILDDCLVCTLAYRPEGSDNWNKLELSTADVLIKENRCRVYTIEPLSPGTNYELKIRCLNYLVNSRYTNCKTKRTLQTAPKDFDIVECNDLSITVQWLRSESDDCHFYELDYRLKGQSEWTSVTNLTTDDSSNEDGCHMYTLENLSSETYYELRMCRYNDMQYKSQYTESKTHKTLKTVLPEAILRLSEEDKIRYNDIMQSSKTEKRHFVRVMIVGKNSAGKTCLMRRLLKEGIGDVCSTDGVDIVVRRCKINIETGEWTIVKEIEDDKIDRIKRAVIQNERMKIETTEGNHSEIEYIDIKDDKSKDKTDDSQYDLSDVSAKNNETKNVDDLNQKDATSNVVLPKRDKPFESSTNALKMNEDAMEERISGHRGKLSTLANSIQNENEKGNEIEPSTLLMPSDLMSHVFSKSTTNSSSNRYALCELWDFAGQKEFYATHQAFLTSSAVYLVVADMTDYICKQGINQCFADFQDIGEYVDFWFNSIHCHRTTNNTVNDYFDPPILLVFTGKDKYDKIQFENRKKELDKHLDDVLGRQSKYHHLRGKFYLSNTNDCDGEFEQVRNAIYENAKKMDNWGQHFPLKWILYEHLIAINKNNGKNFTNYDDMVKMAKHNEINIHNPVDLLLFLRFQHNVGNIIFFETIKDLIILKPQWLADSFRCLVSDNVDNSLHHLEDWTELKEHGKISEYLITKLFESKTGSQFSGQKVNLHKIMEKLDILVKIESTDTYIMPSEIPPCTFDNVCTLVGIKNCRRTSWLCLKFDFLPPCFFHHLSAWLIRKYKPCKLDKISSALALYRGICIFDINSNGCQKLLVTMSSDTIALQILSFLSQQKELEIMCTKVLNELEEIVKAIKDRYQLKLSLNLHFNCSEGIYYKDTMLYQDLKKTKEYYCSQCRCAHRSEELYSPWLKNEEDPGTDYVLPFHTLNIFKDNTNSVSDPKIRQLAVFYCDVAQKVLRELVTFSIQKNKYEDWKDFLGDNIHEIYHLWKNTLCCRCSEERPPVLLRKPVLKETQINQLLNTGGSEKNLHCIKVQANFQKQCSCNISINPTSKIEYIDCSLLVSLLRHCVCIKYDYANCRESINALIEVRNQIAHAPGSQLSSDKFEPLWRKLTTAVFKLAEKASQQPGALIELVKSQIKDCQEQGGTSEQMKKGKEYLKFIEELTTIETDTSISINGEVCSGVLLAETLGLEKVSFLEKLRKNQRYDEFWFVLRSPGLLEYYTENPGTEDVMPLHRISISTYTEIKIEKDNTFKLVIGNKKLKLKASSEESREKWIKAIQAVQKRHFSKTMFSSFYLPDMPDELTDISAGQATDEVKELASESEPRKSMRMSKLFEVPKKPTQVVAAIDFGTTFSGAAFSTKSSFVSNPLRVEIIQLDKKKSYHKTQTSVLFNADEFVAFGEQAERKYKTLSLKGQACDLFFFRNFKMQLHGEKLSKCMKLRTIDGREKSCITVIAACIEHIKEKANERIKKMNKGIRDIDIHWVLTVPAIWSEQARQFMIKAAEKTGIDRDNLSLALEPECAAVYCKHDELVKDECQLNSALQSFRPGSKFMVVDLGGGTVDITISEVLESGKMKEISKASGGKWGGDTINKKIVDVLNEIFGPEINRLRTEEMHSYLEILADIESAKREYDGEDDFVIRLPEFLQNQVNVEKLAGKFGNNISYEKKYLLFSQETIKDIFSKCIYDITKHIVGLLEEAIGVYEIILVGGYASSPIVQTAFENEFGQKFKLIIPQNPETVVLTGAVIFGHSKEPITGRVAKYNYGLGIRASVDPGDRNLLHRNDRHKKIFHLLIEKGRRMDVGKYVVSCKIKVDDSNQLDSIELYITKSDNPEHEININDFTKIGTIKFKLPKLRKPTTFTVSLWNDETEFRVMAEDENTNLHFEGIIQYFE